MFSGRQILFYVITMFSVTQLRGPAVPTDNYKVVQVYPHDAQAFTQGLVYVEGHLYESTGLNGRSMLRMTVEQLREKMSGLLRRYVRPAALPTAITNGNDEEIGEADQRSTGHAGEQSLSPGVDR